MNQKTKQIIISLVVIVIAFFGMRMFFDDGIPNDATFVADRNSPEFVDGQAVLLLLNRLSKVTLSESIFSSAVFNGLVSFEKPIPDQVIYRPNPFAPIGSDGSGIIAPVSTSTLRATSSATVR